MTLPISQLPQETARALDACNQGPSALTADVRAAMQSHLGRNISAVADFLHLNPSMPTRELTGIKRLDAVRTALADRGVGMLNVVYDLTMPIHEMAREGGGAGFRLGFLPRSVKIIGDARALYCQQSALPLDTQAVRSAIHQRYHDKGIDIDKPPQRDRFDQVMNLLDLFNDSMQPGDDARRSILRFKMNAYKNLTNCHTDDWVSLSDLIPLVFRIIEILDNHGVPWFQIPTNGKGYIARIITSDGTYTKVANADGKPVVDSQTSAIADWGDLIAKGQNSKLLPSVELYLLTLVIAPGLCHFGNLYGNHTAVEQWLSASLGQKHNLIRIAGDYENSIPLGQTTTTTRHGHEHYSLLSVDAGIIPEDELRTAIDRTAATAEPGWHKRDFEHDFIQP